MMTDQLRLLAEQQPFISEAHQSFPVTTAVSTDNNRILFCAARLSAKEESKLPNSPHLFLPEQST